MCLAIPGQIVELIHDDQHYAIADVSGVQRKINIDILKDKCAAYYHHVYLRQAVSE
ncbi:HypC/HybG/HupF family hydrogenase formation chaperone [Thermolongibacillus altinsuensis]|uniref:HypC/HybG/HupF family hydrogenase formation chaperone n=1 Tax=Thermolongibacillus altinsuensis TaxID=575256 RepID=UPI00242A3064|nr:HypC/HybG/HupF family hydrogenase formation chaperone [Thermolongibacillus altinsuensis]GMB08186.1 hypothetical protein B1no1_08960 [Thermolongibacillus altinsuensis]